MSEVVRFGLIRERESLGKVYSKYIHIPLST